MKQFRELTYEDLIKNICNPEELKFETTDELKPYIGVIGEERAKKALEFGMKINMKGYNLYIAGPSGTGKTTYAKTYVNQIASKKEAPCDWCYVYNFENKECPKAISFKTGAGKKFKKDIAEFVEDLMSEIKKAFSEEEYQNQKNRVLCKHDGKKDKLMEEITKRAKEMGFAVKTSSSGIYFMPLVDGQVINEEQYEELQQEKKDEITGNSQIIQKEAVELTRKIKALDKESKLNLDKLDYEIGLFAVGHHIIDMKEKYKEHELVIKYLESLKEDILENIQELVDEEDDMQDGSVQQSPWQPKKRDAILTKYKVNLFVDNTKTKGAPVVLDFNPTYNKLIGQVEYNNEFGNLTTDFTKIKSGLLQQANGGYLILQASDILKNSYSWEALKRVLKTKEITIESLRDQFATVAVSTIKPEPIPVDLKVILIGDNYLYHMLFDNDDDFSKLFKIKVDFDTEIEKSHKNIMEMARFIKGFCEREKIASFDKHAVARIIEYSSRLIENQNKMSTRFDEIVEILSESSVWSGFDESNIIKDEHVKKAIFEKEQRSNLYEEKLDRMIEEEMLMIDIKGKRAGQINGLAVLDTGDYTFGKPTRITVTTYMGKAGVINIEKEADMSGKIHNKGVQVLIGYLGQKFAQDIPLSLSCRISFEQNYSGIDGDSASSTELYAIFSSLSEIPIKQNIAVTGSINQWGEIQPIGGVTHKVEGFYKLCRQRGLTGDQGVIIPNQNIKDLVLKEEVIQAIKENKFHIYPVKNVDEGIEILTGFSAGKKNDKGKYPKESVYGKVADKLKKFDSNVSK
ncbi:MAG TPA: ATP-dependent protease [Clostridiales bacterium]|nr:ATP-dependent protease [Clostridiales bacterium]